MAGFDDPITLGLLGASAGFLDPHGGMNAGFQGGMNAMLAGRQMQQQDVLAKMQQQKMLEQLQMKQTLQDTISKQQESGKVDPVSIGNALIATGHPEAVNMGFGILKDFRSKVKSVQKGYDEQGNAKLFNVFDTGETKSTGISPAEKALPINQGSQYSFLDPYTLQPRGKSLPIGMSQGEAARIEQQERQFAQSHGLAQQQAQFNQQKSLMELDPEYQARKAESISGGKERGQMQAKAVADLPQAIQQGNETIKLVDDLLQHPGFKWSVGKTAPIGSALALVPGTDESSFDIALNQLKGKQFLEAFQSLKGGGAITEIEGQKAQQAMSRMEKANTEQEFTKAAREFQGIVKQGVNIAKMKAGVTNSDIQSMPSAASNDGWGELR